MNRSEINRLIREAKMEDIINRGGGNHGHRKPVACGL